MLLLAMKNDSVTEYLQTRVYMVGEWFDQVKKGDISRCANFQEEIQFGHAHPCQCNMIVCADSLLIPDKEL